jgi:hypothetical protein
MLKEETTLALSSSPLIGVGYKVMPSEEVVLISFLLEISTMVWLHEED